MLNCKITTITIVFILALVNPSFSLAAVPASNAKKEYSSAKTCMKTLYSSHSKKKWRSNWEKCIKRFKKIVERSAATVYVDDSIFFTAKLYHGLYKYSNKKSDLKKAKNEYKKLLVKFPKSPLAKKTRIELASIEKKLGKKKKTYSSPLPSRASNTDAKKSYSAAKSCMKSLYSSPKKRKWRSNWGKCIKRFKNVVKISENTVYVDDSIFFTAKLYHGLYKYSNKKSDLKKAQNEYEKLLAKFPRSPLAKKTKNELASIEKKLGKKKQKSAATRKTHIKKIRYWSHADFTRVVIDTTSKTRYKSYSSKSPNRILLDIFNADIRAKKKSFSIQDGIVQKVSAYYLKNDSVRIKLDLNKPASFKVMPFSNPDRLVIDISHQPTQPQKVALTPQSSKEPGKIRLAQQLGMNIRKIVIDPGHGGKDPGAIGKSGIMEKDIVLDISRHLRNLIQSKLSSEVVMTRDRDVYVPLEKRTVIANAQKADLFISIHANSSTQAKANGLEVYLLGQSSDKKAMRTAARENSTSEMAMSDLETILNDLLISNKVNESLEFAHMTKNSLVNKLSDYKIKDKGVKRAPFYVLMNAAMPSILVEVSFISNPKEEKLLQNSKYRRKIAEAIFKGIENYIASLKLN